MLRLVPRAVSRRPAERLAQSQAPLWLGLGFPPEKVLKATARGLLCPAKLRQALAKVNSGILRHADCKLRDILPKALSLATPELALARARKILKAGPDELQKLVREGRLSLKRINVARQILEPYASCQVDRLRSALNAAANWCTFRSSLPAHVRHELEICAPTMHGQGSVARRSRMPETVVSELLSQRRK